MAGERSDKSKTKPSNKEEKKTGKSGERMPTRADPTERAMSGNPAQHNSLQVTAGSKKRHERQRMGKEPSADLRKSEKVSEQMLSSASPDNQGIEDSSAHHRISEQAFILFQARGYEHGNDWAHWFEAERQIEETQQIKDTQA